MTLEGFICLYGDALEEHGRAIAIDTRVFCVFCVPLLLVAVYGLVSGLSVGSCFWFCFIVRASMIAGYCTCLTEKIVDRCQYHGAGYGLLLYFF